MVSAWQRAFEAGRGRLSWYRPADLEATGAASSPLAGEYRVLLERSGDPRLYRELAATWAETCDQILDTIGNLTATAA